MALGHGGQTVLTFPALNLIVATTANNRVDWDPADAQERALLEIVSRYILPATVVCFFSVLNSISDTIELKHINVK